jgi:hypothetical protein
MFEIAPPGLVNDSSMYLLGFDQAFYPKDYQRHKGKVYPKNYPVTSTYRYHRQDFRFRPGGEQ